MEFQLGDVVISELLDEHAGTSRRGFYGSTLPLSEWLVEAWPRLLLEGKVSSPNRPDWREWMGYHHFRAGRQGGAMPDLRLTRLAPGALQLEAVPDLGKLKPGIHVRFLRAAVARLDAGQVERELALFVDATCAKIAGSQEPRAIGLRDAWSRARGDAAVRVLGRLGVDPDCMDPADTSALERLLEEEDRELLVDVAEGVQAARLGVRLETARFAVGRAGAGERATRRWTELGRKVFDRRAQPWLTGWDAAAKFRAGLGLAGAAAPDRDLGGWLADRCGWQNAGNWRRWPSSHRTLDTLHLRRAGEMPVLVSSASTQKARRFRLARSLYYFLFSRPTDQPTAILDGGVLTMERSEANAFAAELLAPVERLRELEPEGGQWDCEAVSRAANELCVDNRVIEHQVWNRELGVLRD